MKILALTNLYPNPYQPHRAPYNRHQFRMLGEMHALRVIAPIAWADEWAARRTHPPLPSGRQLTRDGLTVDHPRYWYTPKILRRFYGRFFLASVRHTFQRAIAEFSPDVIFAPWAYPDGFAAVALAREAGLPAVVQVHGSDIRQLAQFPARIAGTAAAVQQATGVIAVCRDLAEGVIRLGAAPENVQVITDGIDRRVFFPACRRAAQEQLGLRSDRRHLLFIGNLVPVKGVDILLQACGELAMAVGAWQLHIIGDGPQRAALARQAQSLGLGERVTFHGSLPHERLPVWFRGADLFVLASRSEGIPNVLLEAMGCGLPFVATNVGGIPEIAELGHSQLVPPERPLELAAAISNMLSSPSRATPGPRDRREAVVEIAKFLESCAAKNAVFLPALSAS